MFFTGEGQGAALHCIRGHKLVRFWLASAAWLVLVLPGLAHAVPKPPVFSTELKLVKVVVTVHDEEGRVVDDLKTEDFTVLEDGQTQSLDFFARSVDAEGPAADREQALVLDLGMLMDTSASMSNEMSLSQQAAIRFLDAVPRARELLTIFFDRDIRISKYDSENQQGLFERILDTQAGDRTAFRDAVAVYLSRVQEGSGRKVAVLFTDGVDTYSHVSFPDLLDMVRASEVVIYAIGFKGEPRSGAASPLSASNTLRRLATVSGGHAFFPSSYRDLPKIYDQILEDLSGQYVLGFSSKNLAADGKFRKLKVTVRRPNLKIQHREGYFAPEAPQSATK
jgi:Ca-activated chloride channel family protein